MKSIHQSIYQSNEMRPDETKQMTDNDAADIYRYEVWSAIEYSQTMHPFIAMLRTVHRLTKCQSQNLDLWRKEKEFKCESQWYFHRYLCIMHGSMSDDTFQMNCCQSKQIKMMTTNLLFASLSYSFHSNQEIHAFIVISFINQINIMLLRLKTTTADNR